MAFYIELQQKVAAGILRFAGLDVTAFPNYSTIALEPPSLPLTLRLPCFVADVPMAAEVTIFALSPNVRLRVSLPDPATEQAIANYAYRYSAERDGQALLQHEADSFWRSVEAVLAEHGHSWVTLRRHSLSERAVEELLTLADDVSPQHRVLLANVFANGTAVRSQRARVAGWLLDLFEATRDNHDRAQIGLRIDENMVPEEVDRVMALTTRPEFADSRVGLLMALARTRHPKASDIIASLLEEKHLALTGIDMLGKLRAVDHAAAIVPFLKHSQADVRRMARRTLARLGFPQAESPKPVHVVPNRTMPHDLPDYSIALDMDDLEPHLATLAGAVDAGFGAPQIAEIMGVVDRLKIDATRTFRFDIVTQGEAAQLWLSVFLDDVDSPDLAICGPGFVVDAFRLACEE